MSMWSLTLSLKKSSNQAWKFSQLREFLKANQLYLSQEKQKCWKWYVFSVWLLMVDYIQTENSFHFLIPRGKSIRLYNCIAVIFPWALNFVIVVNYIHQQQWRPDCEWYQVKVVSFYTYTALFERSLLCIFAPIW